MSTYPTPTTSVPRSETTSPRAKSFARHIPTVARILLGFTFLVTGLDGFLHFIPPPSGPMPQGIVAFSGALMATGYMFPLIKGTELIVGSLLLMNRFVPLALTLIAPVIVNIVAVHGFLAPSGLPTALVILALELYLAWSYRNAFRPMLASRVRPS